MSELGPILFALAAQVTLPVVGALLLSRRRDPAAACTPLVVAAIAALLLTPVAFVPRPQWNFASPSVEVSATVAIDASVVEDKPLAPSISATGGIDVLKLLRLPVPAREIDRPSRLAGW